MSVQWNKVFVAGLILVVFGMAGCSGSQTADQTEKDIASLHKAIKRKDAEIRSINDRLKAQDELIEKQKADLQKALGIIKEDLGSFEAEMKSFKNGEMVSLKTDLDILGKTVEAIRAKLKKMDSNPILSDTSQGS